MRYFLQVISTGSESLSPSFMLFFDNTRFLFNCGEGMQRYFTQHKIRLVKLHTVLLTRLVWSHVGGLPGLILSAADAGSSGMQIIGPFGTTSFIKSLHPFIKRSNFPVSIKDEFNEVDDLELTPLQVKTFYLSKFSYIPNIPSIDLQSTGMFKGDPEVVPNKKACVRNFKAFHEPSHDTNLEEENADIFMDQMQVNDNGDRLGDIVACYVIQCPDRPGKFSVDKAIELGIFGSKRGLLTKGISVILDDGRLISPSDVISPVEQGKRICVVEIPSDAYFNSAGPMFFHPTNEIDNVSLFATIDLMVYILGKDVENSLKYSTWTNSIKWKPTCRHLVFIDGCHDKPTLFPSSDLLCSFLQKKCGTTYYPYLSEFFSKPLIERLDNINFVQAEPLMRIYLEPEFSILSQEPNSLVTHLLESKPNQINNHSSEVNNINEASDMQYPALIFLGTGSAIPSKYRNVSSILLQICPQSSILLDCGEGTLGQLSRIFATKLNDVISTISVIFISHLHADHHLGISGLLSAIHNLNHNQKITIIGPVLMGSWLYKYSLYFEKLINFNFIPSKKLLNSDCNEIVPGKISIETCPMCHIPSSYSAIIKLHHSQLSLAYSGDTRPCELFSRLVKERNIKIMIHEATFEDDLEAQAISKAHSTWSEAIAVAESSNVTYLLLTHFSQRYPVASPPEIATARTIHDIKKLKVIYAVFDMLRLPLMKLEDYYLNHQNVLLTHVEEEFTLLKRSIGTDSDIEEEIKFT